MYQAVTRLLWGAALLFVPVATSPLAAAPPIEAYGKLPGFEEAAISPNGNRIAMITTLGETRSLIISEAGNVLRRENLGDVKVRDIEWASDDLLMLDYSSTEKLYGFTTDKAEFYRTIIIPATGTGVRAVFGKERRIAGATFGWYGIRQIGGKTYGFFGGVPMQQVGNEFYYRGGAPDLVRVDLDTMDSTKIASRASETQYRHWRIDGEGKVAATFTRKDGSGDWTIENAAGKVIARGTNLYGGVGLRSLGAVGDSVIFYKEDESTGNDNYFEVPLAGGETKPFLQNVDIRRFFVDQRNGRLLGYQADDEAKRIQFFDPIIDKKVQKIAKAFPKLNREVADWDKSFGKVLLTTNGNSDSGTWWTVDLGALRAEWLGIERPAIEAAEVGTIRTFDYKAADGLEMDGILTLPAGKEAKALPVVVLPHGGPTSHDTESFDWWAQAFASRGYAVFQPNFRGSTNRDAAFVRAGHGEWGKKMQTDISDGLKALASQDIVDQKRACIVGASYGGYAALAGVTLQQGLYRCAVSVAGVADLNMMVSTDLVESGSDPTLKRNLKMEIGSGRDLKDVSPRRFAAKADAPILLIHGKDDTVVPYKQSLVMADALKDAAKPHQLITLDSEDHWLSRGDTRLKMLSAAIAFVEKHNPAN